MHGNRCSGDFHFMVTLEIRFFVPSQIGFTEKEKAWKLAAASGVSSEENEKENSKTPGCREARMKETG